MYNKPFKTLIRIKCNESISTESVNINLNIGQKYKVSRDDIINFICQIIDELNDKYHQSKQIFKSFEQCGLNNLCNNTDLFMKHLASLTETSIYKALTDQHKAITVSNEQNIFSNIKHEAETESNEQNISTNDISDCDSDDCNIQNDNIINIMILIIIDISYYRILKSLCSI